MKKLVLFIVALIVFVPLFRVDSVKAEESNTAFISAAEIDKLTEVFCRNEDLKDRTSFTDASLIAAEKIATLLKDNEMLNVEVQKFTETVTIVDGLRYAKQDITSYNVVAFPSAPDNSKKTILITTNFANHYSDNVVGKGVKAEGALNNAATTALVLELANYLPQANDKYNFAFAFFSGTDEGNYGSAAFIDKYLNQNIILVINLKRLGCGNTYYYTDEVTTKHGEFIKQQASGYDLKEFPMAGRVLLDMYTVDDLPYSHYAMRGDISTFLSVGKSCLELIGGDFSGLTDSEGGKTYLTNTGLDTYDKLKEVYPDYAEKLQEAGRFVINLTSKDELTEVCLGAAQGYKIFTQGWVAYVICLGIIMILILIMIFVLRHLEKKYPIPTQPKVKIAVFGKEYEDITENDIVVDIKHNDKQDENPFDI